MLPLNVGLLVPGESVDMITQGHGSRHVRLAYAGKLSVMIDPADLRRLPAGGTLQADGDARLAANGHKARGRCAPGWGACP